MLNSASPTWFQGIQRKASEIEPEFVDTLTPERCVWRGTARYQNDPRSGYGTNTPAQFSFDTTGGSQHITQAESHVASYAPAGASAPDHKGAIGVTSSGVEGVDITVPVYSWSETHFITAANLTGTYRGLLHSLTGKVNNSTFKGFDAGECLFLGASANWSDDDIGAMVTFKFAGSPNRTNLTVGTITGIAKKGWEYVWIEYEQAEDSSASKMVSRPIAAHVEQVYEYGDFSTLGI
jgi:hypothetical protein